MAAHQASVPHHLPKFAQVHVHCIGEPSSHLILWWLLLLPSIFPSTRDFSSESVVHIIWTEYWSFGFSISHSNEYSRLISLKIDWFDLLAVQETLRTLLQHHCSEVSILGALSPLQSSSHNCTWPQKDRSLDYKDFCQQSNISAF